MCAWVLSSERGTLKGAGWGQVATLAVTQMTLRKRQPRVLWGRTTGWGCQGRVGRGGLVTRTRTGAARGPAPRPRRVLTPPAAISGHTHRRARLSEMIPPTCTARRPQGLRTKRCRTPQMFGRSPGGSPCGPETPTAGTGRQRWAAPASARPGRLASWGHHSRATALFVLFNKLKC